MRPSVLPGVNTQLALLQTELDRVVDRTRLARSQASGDWSEYLVDALPADYSDWSDMAVTPLGFGAELRTWTRTPTWLCVDALGDYTGDGDHEATLRIRANLGFRALGGKEVFGYTA